MWIIFLATWKRQGKAWVSGRPILFGCCTVLTWTGCARIRSWMKKDATVPYPPSRFAFHKTRERKVASCRNLLALLMTWRLIIQAMSHCYNSTAATVTG